MSIINKKYAEINKIEFPECVDPLGTPSITPTLGSMVRSATATYIGDGVNFVALGGGGGVSSIGAFDNNGTANGAVIAGTVLTIRGADISNPGAVSISDQTFTGIKRLNNGLKLGNPNVPVPGLGTLYQTLTDYAVYDTNLAGGISLSGPWSAPISTTWQLTRCGNILHIFIAMANTVTNSNSAISVPAGTIPVGFRPILIDRSALCVVFDSNVEAIGKIKLYTNGSFGIFYNINQGFTSGQICGVSPGGLHASITLV